MERQSGDGLCLGAPSEGCGNLDAKCETATGSWCPRQGVRKIEPGIRDGARPFRGVRGRRCRLKSSSSRHGIARVRERLPRSMGFGNWVGPPSKQVIGRDFAPYGGSETRRTKQGCCPTCPPPTSARARRDGTRGSPPARCPFQGFGNSWRPWNRSGTAPRPMGFGKPWERSARTSTASAAPSRGFGNSMSAFISPATKDRPPRGFGNYDGDGKADPSAWLRPSWGFGNQKDRPASL
jgi:hypothetical protein